VVKITLYNITARHKITGQWVTLQYESITMAKRNNPALKDFRMEGVENE